MSSVPDVLIRAFASSREQYVFGSRKDAKARKFTHYRHPELVSGSKVPHSPPAAADKWTLKQVPGDDAELVG